MSSSSTARFSSFTLRREQGIAARPIQESSQEPADIPDEVLLVKISSGDREFLAQLFRRYAPTIFAIGEESCETQARPRTLCKRCFFISTKSVGSTILPRDQRDHGSFKSHILRLSCGEG